MSPDPEQDGILGEVIAQDLPELEAAVERMRAANMTRLPGEDQSG